MDWCWIITAASIVGVIANIYKKSFCFAIWTCTNLMWMIIDLKAGLYAQAFLFAVYVVLAIWGLVRWRRDANAKKT